MISCICAFYTWYRVSTYDILLWGDKMTSKAKLEANERWNKKQDSFLLRFKKGRKVEIKAHAENKGFKSLNAYINDLIDKDMPGD